MSDTRAAIRELRSLSEKRSLGALTEAEAARWLALRRQLGLPLEPEPSAEAPATSAIATPRVEATRSLETAVTGESIPSPEEAPHEQGPASPATEQEWTGPSLDRPSPPAGSAWAGPSLDAPAWSEAAAERQTDPGLDEPPPVPFDEAPAAPRPPEGTEVTDFGGAPHERVPLAPASEFISYGREGNEAIDLPPESGTAEDLEPQSLAQLASAPLSETSKAELPSAARLAEVSPPAAPFGAATEPVPSEPAVALAAELLAASSEVAGVEEGVLPEPALEPQSQQTAAASGGLSSELEMSASDRLGVYEGVVPEAPAELDDVPPSTDEGVLFEPPAELGAVPLEPSSTAGTVAEEAASELLSPLENTPLQLVSPLDEATVPSEEQSGQEVSAPSPAPVSTWAPGAETPPVLAADDFAHSGDPLGDRGLDPWPESLAPEVAAEDVVETVSDEDVVEELPTPTPLPAFPSASPPGSGGIRGFQFPKPPSARVPTPPTPPAWQRTQPGSPTSTPARSGDGPVPAVTVAPTTPAPARRPSSVTLPVPPPPPPKPAPRAPALLAPTPTPPAPAQPFAASAVSPVTPRPTAPPAIPPGLAPVRPTTPVPLPVAAVLAPRAASSRRAPVLTAPPNGEDESLQPLLELVDEVSPPRRAPPALSQPTPSPAAGTPAVFGPPMMLNPSFVEGDHRVVIHTLEGQVHRGTVHNLDLQEDALAVQQPDGRSVQLPTRRLKAVFFVLSPGEKPLAGRGERVQVTFRDGRQVVGYSDDHASGEPGFFVIPSDARTNTARVYVFRGGVQSITTG